MPEFMPFKEAMFSRIEKMKKHPLFTTSTGKDELWDMYLGSFEPEDNPIHKERTEHDCQCCKQFIRAVGGIVAIINGKVVSIWDLELDGPYGVVASNMAGLVKSNKITGPFYHYEDHAGTDKSHQQVDEDVLIWNHFYCELPIATLVDKELIPTKIGRERTAVETFSRALSEITTEAIDTVLELIDQGALYKGTEYRKNVNDLKKAQVKFNAAENKEVYVWSTKASPSLSGIRNSSIGTLLIDLSADMELNKAVERFETVVNPVNYKRPTALVTKAMIEKAEAKAAELGITESFPRRYAVMRDITIDNVIFANRASKKSMGVFDDLKSGVPDKLPELSKIDEMSIDDFMTNIIGNEDNKVTSIEVMLENKHVGNMVSLIAPINPEAPNILKWDNNFSWSYNGEVTDSMKEQVVKAGGRVDALFRFSLLWNADASTDETIDLDAHCYEPNKNHIYYPKNGQKQATSGLLDVDNTRPGKKIAIENITWDNKNKMLEGEYRFVINNYSSRTCKQGFTAELEYDGVIHTYEYNLEMRGGQNVEVVKLDFSKANGIKIKKSLPSTNSVREEWNVSTQKFQNVSVIMYSPNFWDGQEIGNKHVFFMMSDCINPDASRGFYNEFLKPELTEHRKVFEMLGSKLKAPESQDQLSGVGFSSTVRNSIICRVKGTFNRVIKINF